MFNLDFIVWESIRDSYMKFDTAVCCCHSGIWCFVSVACWLFWSSGWGRSSILSSQDSDLPVLFL